MTVNWGTNPRMDRRRLLVGTAALGATSATLPAWADTIALPLPLPLPLRSHPDERAMTTAFHRRVQ